MFIKGVALFEGKCYNEDVGKVLGKKLTEREKRTMKKIFSALLALVMLMGAVFMLASCGAKPELDLETAEKNLKDKEYIVNYNKDYEGEPSIVASLRANKVDGENDYSLYITEYESSAMAKLYYKQLQAQKEYSIDNLKSEIKMLEKYIDLYEDELKSEQIDELNDEIKDLEEELAEAEDTVIGRSGKFVWYGDKEAIDASKGK